MNLTLLVTIFKPSKNEIEYWNNIYYRIKDIGININFLIDNPDFNILNLNKISKSDIFKNASNIGKFKTVYRHIKSGNVETTYFKIVDPDDYVSLKELENIDLNNNDNYIYRMNVVRMPNISGISQNNVESIVAASRKKEAVKFKNFGNSYTILPTLMIFNDNYYNNYDIKTSDDQYLGFLAYVNGAKIRSIDSSFYLYNQFNGYTRIENFKNKLINSFYTWNLIQELSLSTKISYPFDFKKSQLLNYKKMFRQYSELYAIKDQEMIKILSDFEKFSI